MSIATLEQPETTQTELITHEFRDGVCHAPETVEVPMPKGFACTLLVACASDREKPWRAGWSVSAANETPEGELVLLEGKRFATRAAAMLGAETGAGKYFVKLKKKGDKAVAALEKFHEANALAPGLPPPVAKAAPKPASEPVPGAFRIVPVAACTPNPWNRKTIPPEDFAALMESIREEGLLEPIVLRVITPEELPGVSEAAKGAERYEIIAGEQRWKAVSALGLATIEAKVVAGVDQARAKVLTLIENLLRTNLNPVDEAEGYASLVAEGWTQDAISSRVKRSRPRVSNALRLLRLPEEILTFIRAGSLSPMHGEIFLKYMPEGATDEERAAAVPRWKEILLTMARIAVKEKTPASAIARGVPFVSQLTNAGLVVRIDYFSPHKLNPSQKKHPAYHEDGDGWVCFDPNHWNAECSRREEEKARADALEAERVREEAAKKGGKKQLDLSTVASETYVRLDGDQDTLKELVPADKRTIGKDSGGKVTVVTDVELGKRLQKAWQRAVKDNRKFCAEDLRAKVRKKMEKLKKLGAREMAWLLAQVSVPEFRAVPCYMETEACERAGVKLPKMPSEDQFDVLEYYTRCEPADIFRAFVEFRLETALLDVVENGLGGIGARLLRWWLDTDTLWLLEETEEGKAELLNQIKESGWYKKILSGESTGEEKE